MKWFTADLHLGHANIIEYCNRPYPHANAMNDDLVWRWNSMVGVDDEVWVLGDFAMGKLDDTLACVARLNGHKILVPGNHDRMFRCQGTKYRNTVDRYLGAGFSAVTYEEVMLGGVVPFRDVLACHFPYAGDSRDGHEDRFKDERPKDQGRPLVHGHTHGKWRKNGRMVDVGVDAWGGYPVSFEAVGELFTSTHEHAEPLPW